MRAVLVFLLLSFPWPVMSQMGHQPSLLPETDGVRITERKAGYRVIFNFDFRRTFVNGESVRFYGFRLGAQRNKDIIAVGIYGLGDPYVQENSTLGPHTNVDVVTDFDFAGISYERLLIDTKRWQVGVPVGIALGNLRRGYRNANNDLVPYSVNELVPIEVSLHTDYNIFYWLFAGVGGGYRYVLAADRDATITLSDWNYYFKVGLRVGELIKRARKEMHKENGA
jgi:hypothetical protein